MKTNKEDPFIGLGVALIVYFLLAFGLCFMLPSHRQFACFLSGVFIYPFGLLFPAVIIIVVNTLLMLMKKGIPPRFMGVSILVYGPLAILASKLVRHFDLDGLMVVAAISCAIGWTYAVLRPSWRHRRGFWA